MNPNVLVWITSTCNASWLSSRSFGSFMENKSSAGSKPTIFGILPERIRLPAKNKTEINLELIYIQILKGFESFTSNTYTIMVLHYSPMPAIWAPKLNPITLSSESLSIW